mmetsp:Transcript_17961/g.51524  ORF Transcript_17961/g.51524 Transcript_17961/m.51524 type:complete len:97 (+) Transcript_17961:149-439(+)
MRARQRPNAERDDDDDDDNATITLSYQDLEVLTRQGDTDSTLQARVLAGLNNELEGVGLGTRWPLAAANSGVVREWLTCTSVWDKFHQRRGVIGRW